MQPAGPDTMQHFGFRRAHGDGVTRDTSKLVGYRLGLVGQRRAGNPDSFSERSFYRISRRYAEGYRTGDTETTGYPFISGTRVPGCKYPAGNRYYPYPNG